MPGNKRKPTEALILQTALGILRDHGDHGLTMRRLATKAGVSLSNVQYYFRNKDALLTALVEDYFDTCTDFVTRLASEDEECDPNDRLKRFVSRALSNEQEMTEMCAIFRELWAVATRNPKISKQLDLYYRRYADILCQALFPDVEDQDTQAAIKLLIVPYIEGYSIAGTALGGDSKKVASMLENLIGNLCGRRYQL